MASTLKNSRNSRNYNCTWLVWTTVFFSTTVNEGKSKIKRDMENLDEIFMIFVQQYGYPATKYDSND